VPLVQSSDGRKNRKNLHCIGHNKGLQSNGFEHGIFGVDTVYPMFEEAYIMLLLEYPYDANFLI
jgi:hypothetical protein